MPRMQLSAARYRANPAVQRWLDSRMPDLIITHSGMVAINCYCFPNRSICDRTICTVPTELQWLSTSSDTRKRKRHRNVLFRVSTDHCLPTLRQSVLVEHPRAQSRSYFLIKKRARPVPRVPGTDSNCAAVPISQGE